MARSKLLNLAIFLCAAYLAFAGLAHALFWDDEALVAIHARNFLSTGTWTAWTGRNLAAYQNGILLDNRLETKDPKVQLWLAAASFKIFGVSTWAGRFPFVVIGLAGLVVFGLLLKLEFDIEPGPRLYAMAALAFSPVFLLNIRQCRYYAPVFALGLLTFYCYRRTMLRKGRFSFLGLALSAALLFYSHYLVGGAFLAALVFVHLVCFRRECASKQWSQLAAAAGLFFVATVPFLLTHAVWVRSETPIDEAWYVRKPTLFWWYLRDLNTMTCLPWVIAALLLWILVRHGKEPFVRRVAWPWTLFIAAFLACLAAFSFQQTKVPDLAWIRYVLPIVPFCFGLVGIVVWCVARRLKAGACLTLAILVCTNLLTLSPWNHQFRWLLPAYIREVHHAFPTPYRVGVNFIRSHIPKHALVAVEPGYSAYPLMFYLDDHVRFCCLLDSDTALPRETLQHLGAPLFREENFPEWLITFGNSKRFARRAEFYCRPHEERGRQVAYSYSQEADLHTFWFDTSRPELPWHTFGPKKDFRPELESVYVFKRLPAEEVTPLPGAAVRQ